MRCSRKSILVGWVLSLIILLGNTIACRCSLPFTEGASVPAKPSTSARPPVASKPTSTPTPTSLPPTRTLTATSPSASNATPTSDITPTNLPHTPSAATTANVTPSSSTVVPNATPTPTPTPSTAAPTISPTANPTSSPIPDQSPAPSPSPTSPPPPLPQPTDTPTAAPSTPTFTPTPQPTCIPATQRSFSVAGWSIANTCILPEDDDFWWVLGEATNETGNNQEQVGVEATFFAASGSTLANDFEDILADVMPAGSTLPFGVLVESSTAPAEYELDISGISCGETPRDDLQVIDSEPTYAGDQALIVGHVHNPGADLSYYADLIATLYNEQGAVVAIGYGSLSAENLGSNQTAPFEAFVEQSCGSIDSYALVVLGF